MLEERSDVLLSGRGWKESILQNQQVRIKIALLQYRKQCEKRARSRRGDLDSGRAPASVFPGVVDS